MSVIEVAIGYARDPGRFRVQVVDSPVGHASADVDLDVDGLLAGRERFEQTLLLSGIAARRNPTAEEKLIRDAGKALFTALLGTGEMAGRYRAAAAIADERGEDLRIVLRIDAPELAALPWEAMFDEGTGSYVCRQHQLVRHVPVASAPPRLPVQPPLRILGVVSAPRDLPPLDVQRERDQLARALAEPIRNGLVELTWAPEATWAAIHEQLMADEWQVLHFIGHGDFDPERDEGRLALTGEDGMSDDVEASRFADLLRQARPMPRLVVLNSCRGAAASTGDLFSGTAAALARSGVAAVAAMQYSVSDVAAIAFSRGFYTALARARDVDDAVSAGRIGILGTSAMTLEWLTPALYLRGRDARLFHVAAPVAAPATGAGDRAGEELRERSRVSLERASEQWSLRPLHTLKGHSDAVLRLAYSPDSALLATTSSDGTARLWDAASGVGVHVLTGHTDQVSSVAFSPRGNLLATLSNDRTVRLWDIASGASIHVLKGHAGDLKSLVFSPDARMLATSSTDRTVRLWDVATGQVLKILVNTGVSRYLGRHGPQWLRFSPDGSLLAATNTDGKIRLWDVASGKPRYILAGHTGVTMAVEFSLDGALLASGSDDATARLWDVSTGQLAHVLSGHEDYLGQLAFTPDGALLATTSQDRTVRLWDTVTGAYSRILLGHTDGIYWVSCSPDGTLLVTSSHDKTARVWEVATGACVAVLAHSGPVYRALFSPDGGQIATGSEDHNAGIWVL